MKSEATEHLFAPPEHRPYLTLSRCNQALVRAQDEQELNQKVCDILVETGGYLLAWVAYGRGRTSGNGQPKIMAMAGDYPEQGLSFWIDWAETGAGPVHPGLTNSVLRQGRIIICDGHRTLAGNPEANEPAATTKNSTQLCFISLPLQKGQRTFGALNLMSADQFTDNAPELNLLAELAGDLSFGIATIRDRRRYEDDAREKLRLQVQLRQAQKMEAIGTLAGGIAHDFNNMLHVILGYSGLLLKTLPEKSDQHKFSQAIQEAGVSAAGLIRQILTFSRQGEKERRPLQLQQMVKEALRMLRSTLPSTIELKKQINLHCRPVMADATEIHQIIMNLGTNAYHSMQRQGGVLTVELDEVEFDREAEEQQSHLALNLSELEPGRYVCLRVGDTGQGMDQASIQRIFDPYFTTKGRQKGTGLGLTIVLGIIKSYGGAITVWSEPGQGATFKLFFPLLPQKQQENPDLSEVATECRQLPCKKVLFVDDVEYNVILGEHTLSQLGFEVTGVTNSPEALEVFRRFPDQFDLVITDQTMPQLTGFDLAREILQIRLDIPIILLTGYSDLVDENTAKEAGIRSFLIKPIDLDGIARVIRKIFTQD